MPTVNFTVKEGSDPDPSAHLGGSPIIIDDTQIYQIVRGLLAGNVYTLQFVVLTDAGLLVSGYSHIPCEAVY